MGFISVLCQNRATFQGRRDHILEMDKRFNAQAGNYDVRNYPSSLVMKQPFGFKANGFQR